MIKYSYLSILCLMLVFFCYYQPGSSISLDEMEKIFLDVKSTDLTERERELKIIIDRYKDSESVLYIYYKLLSLEKSKYLEDVINEEEYKEIRRKIAQDGIKTYDELSKSNNGSFSLGIYELYYGLFNEIAGELEKARETYENLITKGKDLAPGVKLDAVYYHLVRNLLKQEKYSKAQDLFFTKIDMKIKRKLLFRNPGFYGYIVKNGLLTDSLKFKSEEINRISNDVELAKSPWIFPVHLESYDFQDDSIKNKIMSTMKGLRILKRRVDNIYEFEGFYNDRHISVEVNKTDLTDPFSSKKFHYNLSLSQIIIWSNGPDEDNDNYEITYDPTNGTISNGDITCVKR